MRTNHPDNAAEPRHRRPGPARLAGGNGAGRRARELGDAVTDEDEGRETAPHLPEQDIEEDAPSWQQTESRR